jgi:hypothetical protein
MESYRQGDRLTVQARHRQSGITVLGFLILATLFGIVGLAAIKLTPMYIKNMRLSTVLDDVKQELSGDGPTPALIHQAIERRFDIESIELPRDNIKITQGKNGYNVRIQYENRAPYLADIWLVVAFDKQVEISR